MFLRIYIAFALLALLAVVSEQCVAESQTPGHKPRPEIGLVLSGGGALGLAHIGVLKELEEMHVPVDCVVGTSMGALVGGAYAAGVSPEKMQKTILATDLSALFDDNPPRDELSQQSRRDDYASLFDFTLGLNDWQVQLPSGASAGYKFELFLKSLIGQSAALADMNFDNLPTPYRAVATDLENGSMVVFDRGELSRIMRASMSLPAALAPAEIAGRVYIDGGLSRNLPVDVGRKLCGDVLIAVNLGTTTKPREEIRNSIDVALQSIVILTEQNVKASIAELGPGDILIEPDLDGFDSSSFSSQAEIIERGIVAAQANRESLARLAIAPDDYRAWQSARLARIHPPVKITAITAETSSGINKDAVLHDIHTGTGENFDARKLHGDIVDIFGRGDFSYIGYSVVPQDDEAKLVIKAESKPWGPGYLKLGLGAATDFIGPTQLQFSARYRRAWINSLGAEWRTDMQIGYHSLLRTEFSQPLQVRDGAFVAPYAEASRGFIQFYNKQLRLGDIEVRRVQTGLGMGVTGTIGEIRLGPFINNTSSKPEFGAITTLLPDENFSDAGLELSAVYDQIDRVAFPRSGMFASMNVQTAKQSWHGDDEFTRGQVMLSGAASVGKQTLAAHVEWGNVISNLDNPPVYTYFQLGGPRRLSGLYLDQLTGTHYNLASISVYRQYANLPPQLGHGLYIGISLEAGKINDVFMEKSNRRIASGSLYWGADTALGVAYIGYGISSLNQTAWYFTIGPRF